MVQKKGRPTDNPKGKQIGVRLDEECKRILTEYCEQEEVGTAEAVRRGIKKLQDDIKK